MPRVYACRVCDVTIWPQVDMYIQYDGYDVCSSYDGVASYIYHPECVEKVKNKEGKKKK